MVLIHAPVHGLRKLVDHEQVSLVSEVDVDMAAVLSE